MTELNEQWNVDGLRKRSKLLFGSPHRLPAAVAAATAEEGELYAAMLADQAGIEKVSAPPEFCTTYAG